jgi:putative ABC transport system permease protein
MLIANLIAWPIAWYIMNKWLDNFAYRIDVGISVFVVAAAISLLIAWLTTSYQSIKAATADPLQAIRQE